MMKPLPAGPPVAAPGADAAAAAVDPPAAALDARAAAGSRADARAEPVPRARRGGGAVRGRRGRRRSASTRASEREEAESRERRLRPPAKRPPASTAPSSAPREREDWENGTERDDFDGIRESPLGPRSGDFDGDDFEAHDRNSSFTTLQDHLRAQLLGMRLSRRGHGGADGADRVAQRRRLPRRLAGRDRRAAGRRATTSQTTKSCCAAAVRAEVAAAPGAARRRRARPGRMPDPAAARAAARARRRRCAISVCKQHHRSCWRGATCKQADAAVTGAATRRCSRRRRR